MSDPSQQDTMLTAAEVAALFGAGRTAPQTWARAGKIPAVRTPGGRWLFPERQVRAMLVAEPIDLDSVLAAARTRTGADYIAIDWATCDDDDGQVTVLLRRDGMSVYGLAETPSAALAAAEEKLRAHDEQHAGGAR